MSCERCTDRVVMPAAADVPENGPDRFHVRISRLTPDDDGPCVLFALPDGQGMRWQRLTRADALELAAAIVAAIVALEPDGPEYMLFLEQDFADLVSPKLKAPAP